MNLTGKYKFSSPETVPDGPPVFFNPGGVISIPVAYIEAVEGRRAAATVTRKNAVADVGTGCQMRKLIKRDTVCISVYQFSNTPSLRLYIIGSNFQLFSR